MSEQSDAVTVRQIAAVGVSAALGAVVSAVGIGQPELVVVAPLVAASAVMWAVAYGELRGVQSD